MFLRKIFGKKTAQSNTNAATSSTQPVAQTGHLNGRNLTTNSTATSQTNSNILTPQQKQAIERQIAQLEEQKKVLENDLKLIDQYNASVKERKKNEAEIARIDAILAEITKQDADADAVIDANNLIIAEKNAIIAANMKKVAELDDEDAELARQIAELEGSLSTNSHSPDSSASSIK